MSVFDSAFSDSNATSYPVELLSTPRWYALRTRSRAEKQADRLLERAGVESYPAVATVEREWSDRTQRVGMPLFPGYIFARFRLTEIGRPLSMPGVVGVVRNKGVPVPLRDREIESVRRLADGITSSGVFPSEADFFEPGEPVLVTAGPFEGMEGVLLEIRGRGCVAIRLSAIRQAQAVELDRSLLKRSRPVAS